MKECSLRQEPLQAESHWKQKGYLRRHWKWLYLDDNINAILDNNVMRDLWTLADPIWLLSQKASVQGSVSQLQETNGSLLLTQEGLHNNFCFSPPIMTKLSQSWWLWHVNWGTARERLWPVSGAAVSRLWPGIWGSESCDQCGYVGAHQPPGARHFANIIASFPRLALTENECTFVFTSSSAN